MGLFAVGTAAGIEARCPAFFENPPGEATQRRGRPGKKLNRALDIGSKPRI
jgi:hypothetical protein